MEFKNMLAEVKRATDALAAAAAKLENKHLADIISGASGRLQDALGHPDVDNVDPAAVVGAVTGEANPMDTDPPGKVPPPAYPGTPFPPAQTGEPNPTQQ